MGKTIEETYKKVDSLEHVLLRPDMYVGSIESSKEKMWVFDSETTKFVQKEIEFIPALYKIYDEILVNAADNKVRDPNQNMVKVVLTLWLFPQKNLGQTSVFMQFLVLFQSYQFCRPYCLAF